MDVVIDPGRCIGAARCVRYAPAVFTQNDDGVAELLAGGVRQEDEHKVTEAVLACPVQAISRT